jgi:hypothetical protein
MVEQYARRVRRVYSARLNDRVKRKTPDVRTLDAIHLATLDVLNLGTDAIRVVTRDRRFAANASAMGYRVLPE